MVEVELAIRGGVGGFSKLHNREFGVFTDRAGVTPGPVWVFGALPGADLIFGHLIDEVNYCVGVEVTIDIVRIGGRGRRLAGRNIDSSIGGYLAVFNCDDDGRHKGIYYCWVRLTGRCLRSGMVCGELTLSISDGMDGRVSNRNNCLRYGMGSR